MHLKPIYDLSESVLECEWICACIFDCVWLMCRHICVRSKKVVNPIP